MLNKIDPCTTPSWKRLADHHEKIKDLHMKDFFKQEKNRFKDFSLRFNDLMVDFSKNRITRATLSMLMDLARETGVEEAVSMMFRGEKINETEDRSVLHVALRNLDSTPVFVDGKDVMEDINRVLEQMRIFSTRVYKKELMGYADTPIRDIVNIGIGGSDLGPRMVTAALAPYAQEGLNVHFVSNVDGAHISRTLDGLDPSTTLFIIASKSFTTKETMTNAATAKHWFLERAKSPDHVARHFIAISTNRDGVEAFGIDPGNMFEFWDWVGGRYSLWSAIGLSIACYIGFDNFKALLRGGYAMDCHFRETPLERNIPVVLAMIGIWYVNFFKFPTEAILPYDQGMERFPAYLQQACMESNGKSCDRNGKIVHYKTSPVVWGEPGTNGQHAFYQLLHQGTQIVPCDFLVPSLSSRPVGDHHTQLVANCFAQAKALMEGRSEEEVQEEMGSGDQAKKQTLLPHRVFQGNRPSNTILFKRLTPETLGSIIAMYEYKVFVQGVVWNIFSFDQWGVELGKLLADQIIPQLSGDDDGAGLDGSTNGLINIFKQMRSDTCAK